MSARGNGKLLTRETPVEFCLLSWDELPAQLAWTFEMRGGAGTYSARQGPRLAVFQEFYAWVVRSPGMDVRILREGGHSHMARRYLLAERIGRELAGYVRSSKADSLREQEVKRFDPPLLIESSVDEEFAGKLIAFEREHKCSRRVSSLASMGGPLRPGTVMSRRRTERVADELAIKQVHLAQLTAVGVAIAGSDEANRELADSVEYDYFATPRGEIANGGILLNPSDPAREQTYGAVVLRDARVRGDLLCFDNSIDTAERERVTASLFQNAGIFVR